MSFGIIDADSIAYRAAAAAQDRVWKVFPTQESRHSVASFQYKEEALEWAGLAELESPRFELEIEPQPLENAYHNVSVIIEGIVEELALDNYHLYLTGDDNYRFEIATIKPYKGNRVNVEKPHHLKACRDYLVRSYGAEMCDGYEADDAVAMDGWANKGIIISIDKDLDTVPGEHYDWVKKKRYTVSDEQASYNFYYQMITGDTTDNIQGIPKSGPKAAEKILEASDNYKCSVGLAYACSSYEDPEAAFEENARLLWMSKKSPNDWSWDD